MEASVFSVSGHIIPSKIQFPPALGLHDNSISPTAPIETNSFVLMHGRVVQRIRVRF